MAGHWKRRLKDREDLCRLINGRTVYFAGDSLTQEFAATFINQGVYAVTEDKSAVPPFGIFHFVDAYEMAKSANLSKWCEGTPYPSFQMHWRRFYHLPPNYDNFWGDPEPYFEKPSVLVLNTGIHMDENWADEVLLYNRTFTYLTNNYPNLTIIYRSTHIGQWS
jgi:hypothetical protein